MLKKILDLIYPPRCTICGEILHIAEEHIHSDCYQQLFYIKSPQCLICGKPLFSSNDLYCAECRKYQRYYNEGRGLWIYDGMIKESLYRFKYKNQKNYQVFYAQELIKHFHLFILDKQIDVILPIPISKKKYKQRGYNQSYLISKAVGKRLKIAVDCQILKRNHHTQPQKELGFKARSANLKNAFFVDSEKLIYKNILLIDDIYTTGATMNTCAKLLKEADPTINVYYLVLCMGRNY